MHATTSERRHKRIRLVELAALHPVGRVCVVGVVILIILYDVHVPINHRVDRLHATNFQSINTNFHFILLSFLSSALSLSCPAAALGSPLARSLREREVGLPIGSTVLAPR